MVDSSDYAWIVLVIIIGAGALVCCAYAVFRFYGDTTTDGIKSLSNEQLEYMRGVRNRNIGTLDYMAR
ncbi:hypothetical protein EJ08DRAFT_709886 [Tothia fuscella]|uniref:Uncharacterized protein n=1 Tax=Tothia fuscella TaxID=1048955 RepID=A0A9P4NUM0_9PEZI|nr:hypothetical protein EJ08DRAFT_709886 [Tothia fuscella]